MWSQEHENFIWINSWSPGAANVFNKPNLWTQNLIIVYFGSWKLGNFYEKLAGHN